MKHLIIIFGLLATFAVTSCDKSSTKLETNDLVGTWNLIQVSGGITGQGYTAGFDAIKFTESTFDLLKSKSSIGSGTYVLNDTKDSLKITSAPFTNESFANIAAKKIDIDKNNLVLTEQCCDLYQYNFSRSLE
ncbi:MAG: hypothetical protein ABI844_12570 [Saprospiraceae bacterium]